MAEKTVDYESNLLLRRGVANVTIQQIVQLDDPLRVVFHLLLNHTPKHCTDLVSNI
jgi:hypothetical protein